MKVACILACCIGAATLGLTAGCAAQHSTAPAPASPSAAFSSMPGAPTDGNVQYKRLTGTVTGKNGVKTLSVPFRTHYMLWLGCLGTGGFVTVKSQALDLDTQRACGHDGQIVGWQFDLPRAASSGMASIKIDAPVGGQWELGLDGA